MTIYTVYMRRLKTFMKLDIPFVRPDTDDPHILSDMDRPHPGA